MPSLRIHILSAAFHFQLGPEKLLNFTPTCVTGFPVNAVDEGLGEAEALELAERLLPNPQEGTPPPVEKHGQREALVVRHQNHRCTWQQLWDMTTQLARALQRWNRNI